MSLYRGAGGASDATDDSTVNAVAGYASSAASSASAAAASATTATNNATAAATSASQAASSTSSAATSASNAATSASNAAASASSASSSASSASTSATNASNSVGTVSTYASVVLGYRNTAATHATNAASSASAAAGSATSAANSAASALAIYGNTAAMEAAVADAVEAAATAQQESQDASDSAVAAAASEALAFEHEQNAAEWATVAQGSANSAAASASSALAIYGNTSAMNQAVQTATTSASTAVSSASSATTSATNAAASATSASSSATSAAASAAAASAVVLGNEPVRPTIRPSLLLDFANTKQLDPRITFTRASTATFYDGVTTAKAEENLLLQSQTLDNASWVATNATVTSNTSVSPDGTTTAETITDDAVAQTHRIAQLVTITANSTYVFSCYLKAGTSSFAHLSLTDTVNNTRYFAVDFNLSTGAVRASSNGANGTLTSSSITSVANGWYRCVIIGQLAVVSSNVRAVIGVSDGTTAFNALGLISYTGTGSTIIAWGAQLEQRSAVTAYIPTTTAPITNYILAMQTAASGVARFDHNPVTKESLGLEIEEQRTNLFTYSDQFDNADWNKIASSIVTNAGIAPNGTLTAEKLVGDTTTAASSVGQTVSATAGSYTLSILAKAAEQTTKNHMQLLVRSNTTSTNNSKVKFDLVTGAWIGDIENSGTGFTGVSRTFTDIGNGWYRLTFTVTVPTETIQGRFYQIIDGVTNIINDGFSGPFIWGAQLEAGAFATSYIPTVASQVTRAADAASMTGTNFSSWYNQAEGSFFSSVVLNQAPALSGSAAIYTASDNTASNRILVACGTGASGNINALVTTGGVLQAQTINGSLSTAGAYLYANAYRVNDFASAVNGGVAVADTSGTVPIVDRLYLGATAVGSVNLNSTIRKIAYYPLRVTNAQLQAITAV